VREPCPVTFLLAANGGRKGGESMDTETVVVLVLGMTTLVVALLGLTVKLI
jgi:hypothetical protein